MKKHQREFLHCLAEDFGFDSESLDPEPHRHVMIFKTPRFTAAPMKTLAQAARIKKAQLNISAPVETVVKKRQPLDYNGFLLIRPKFGLMEDDLKPYLRATQLKPVFLTATEDVALVTMPDVTGPPRNESLESLQPILSAQIVKNELASSVALCQFDFSRFEPHIVHVDHGHDATKADGWSKVAAKKGSPMNTLKVSAVRQKPIYTALGSKLAEAKRKKMEEEEKKKALERNVVDDWEAEMEEGEQGILLEEEKSEKAIE
jgi:transcriptional repressor NF-X1